MRFKQKQRSECQTQSKTRQSKTQSNTNSQTQTLSLPPARRRRRAPRLRKEGTRPGLPQEEPSRSNKHRGARVKHKTVHAYPLKNSSIRVWVLPVEPHPGCAEGYNGWTIRIAAKGARPEQLHRNQRLLVGLKKMWPGTDKCRFCLGTEMLAVCP